MKRRILPLYVVSSLVSAFLFAALPARADLVSHWSLDGTLEDSGPGGNDGAFVGDVDATYGDGHDSAPGGAVTFDGLDDAVYVTHAGGLPIYDQPAFSVVLWVKGLPQADKRVFSEGSTTSNTPLFNIGTERTGATGKVDIYIRTATGTVIVNHLLSQGDAFDGLWHHLAWVDENGQAVLYLDGVRDGAVFNYSKPAIAFDTTSIGGIQRMTPCCYFTGQIDDVRVYDHALSEEEVQALLPGTQNCPPQGDTHCDVILVEGPPDGSPGQWTATAIDAQDETGDPIRYLFTAAKAGSPSIQIGPQAANSAVFDLTGGEWTVSVTVDDDLFCPDQASDATCSRQVVVGCPPQGDTHCSDLVVTGPATGGPGLHNLSVLGATDDSGDPIAYTFSADNGVDPPLRVGPQPANFADLFLGPGDWTITASVDDSALCPDLAPDASCSTQVSTSCPATGDTHLDDFVLESPAETVPGTYRLTAAANDDSGDLINYTFTARRGAGPALQVGPGAAAEARFTLSAGDWTLGATVDDDPNCPDQADDGARTLSLSIPAPPPTLVSRWSLDETIEDQQPAGNHGIFQGDVAPVYAEGQDLNPLGAVTFDGIDDLVEVEQVSHLPIYANDAYSVAVWVKGLPQPDRRVFSEGSKFSNTPLVNVGTQNGGTTGQVDIFIRDDANRTLVAHRLSSRIAFDDSWHHLAWVDDGGRAALYIDGVRDATDFSYVRGKITLDTTSFGGIVRAASCCWFGGSLDDLRIYNYALAVAEVEALVPEPAGCPVAGDTHCGTLEVAGPAQNGEGAYTLSAVGASDGSGDPVLYTFVARDQAGRWLQAGPQPEDTATLVLRAGRWTLSVTADDDLACRDRAPDAISTTEIEVTPNPAGRLVSWWKLDGDLDDAQASGNHGTFTAVGGPTFGEDRDGNPSSALVQDGADDFVLVTKSSPELPLFYNFAFSVAMWVKGGPQPDHRVFSESSRANNTPLFNIGTQNGGTTGQVDIYIRNDANAVVVNHVLSTGVAFDNAWHHLAWVDSYGEAVLYIDGARDATNFTYPRPAAGFTVDTTTIGGILRANPSHFFNGALDDVRIYDYALTETEVKALVVKQPEGTPFKRGDGDASGAVDITDAIFNLSYQFLGTQPPACLEALDDDDNGQIEISDPIYSLSYQFLGGPAPPAPGTQVCGLDGTPDELGCSGYLGCE